MASYNGMDPPYDPMKKWAQPQQQPAAPQPPPVDRNVTARPAGLLGFTAGEMGTANQNVRTYAPEAPTRGTMNVVSSTPEERASMSQQAGEYWRERADRFREQRLLQGLPDRTSAFDRETALRNASVGDFGGSTGDKFMRARAQRDLRQQFAGEDANYTNAYSALTGRYDAANLAAREQQQQQMLRQMQEQGANDRTRMTGDNSIAQQLAQNQGFFDTTKLQTEAQILERMLSEGGADRRTAQQFFAPNNQSVSMYGNQFGGGQGGQPGAGQPGTNNPASAVGALGSAAQAAAGVPAQGVGAAQNAVPRAKTPFELDQEEKRRRGELAMQDLEAKALVDRKNELLPLVQAHMKAPGAAEAFVKALSVEELGAAQDPKRLLQLIGDNYFRHTPGRATAGKRNARAWLPGYDGNVKPGEINKPGTLPVGFFDTEATFNLGHSAHKGDVAVRGPQGADMVRYRAEDMSPELAALFRERMYAAPEDPILDQLMYPGYAASTATFRDELQARPGAPPRPVKDNPTVKGLRDALFTATGGW